MMECVWRPAGALPVFGGISPDDIYSEVTFSLDTGEKYKAVQNQSKYYRIEQGDAADPIVLHRDPPDNTGGDDCKNQSLLFAKLKTLYDRIPAGLFASACYCSSATDDLRKNIIAYDAFKKIFLDDHSGFYPFISLFNNYGSEPPVAVKIKENDSTMKDISRKVQIIEIQNTRRAKLSQERDRVLREIDELNRDTSGINNKISVLRIIISDLESVRELREELSSIKKEVLEEQNKLESMTAIKKEIEILFPQFRHLDCDDSEYLDSLQRIFIEIRNINEKIGLYRLAALKNKTTFVRIALAGGSSAAAAALFAAVDFSMAPNVRNIIIPAAAAFAMTVSAAMYILFRLYPKKSELTALLLDKDNIENRLKDILEKGRFQIEGYRLSELYEFFLQYFEDYIEYVDINTELKNLEREIKDSEYISATENRLSELNSSEKELRGKIGSLMTQIEINAENPPDAAAIEHMINIENGNLAGISIKTEEKKSILSKLDEELAQCRGVNDEYDALEKISVGIEKETSILRKRIKTLDLISSALSSAAEQREKMLVRKLVRRTHDIFHAVTENQHISAIDDLAIEKIIRLGELPEGMNLGLAHLLLMTIKLSISDFLIDSNMSLPLIIDEPFHFLDSHRLDRLRKVIEETALKRQIIILTHHQGRGDWGNYIELK